MKFSFDLIYYPYKLILIRLDPSDYSNIERWPGSSNLNAY